MKKFKITAHDNTPSPPGSSPEGRSIPTLQDLLAGLNERQREAVTTTEGYVRVIAGAGSGKTKTLACRFAYIVNELGISASNILCVTFTNKAAGEMKKRVGALVDMGSVNDFICTYHGFCVKVLREDIDKIAYPRNFIIMDQEDQKTLLREIYEELGLKQTDLTFDRMADQISQIKHQFPYIEDFIDADTAPEEIAVPNHTELASRVFLRYIQKQRKGFLLDFDDLMLFTIYILEKDAEVLTKWQNRLDYIMVDETQDNSSLQWKLVDMLQEAHKNLFVVGDPDQCIYEWRGARPETLVRFDQTHSPCTTIILDRNYRSTPDILNVANSVIAYNVNRVAKDLHTTKGRQTAVTHFHGTCESDEGLFITRTIERHLEAGAKPSDIAVLFRAAHMSRFIEQALIKAKIPYTVYGGTRFFERKEIKDVLAYLRLVDTGDDLAFARAVNQPRRKLGRAFMSHLAAAAAKDNTTLYEALVNHIQEKELSKTGALELVQLIETARQVFGKMSLSDATQFILERSGLLTLYRTDGDQDRVDNLNELITSIRQYEEDNINEEDLSLTRYLQDIALYTNLDQKRDADSVKIMTIHQSKGLEFPIVFVAGMTEGAFPNHRSIRDFRRRGLEEERRLAYVAITRAENSLYLTESEGFNFQGSTAKYPSRFIFEIKETLLVRQGTLTKRLEEEARQFIRRVDSEMDAATEEHEGPSPVGQRVKHKVFGPGTITMFDASTNTLTVHFDTSGATKHFAAAQLGRVLDLL